MNTNILVTNVDNLETLTTLEGEIAVGPWLEDNGYSIVSLDADPEDEYGYIAVVAKDAARLSLEATMKLEIALELEELEGDDFQDMPIAAFVNPTAFTPPVTTNTTSGAKMKAHQYLSQLITSRPGISRTDVYLNQALRDQFIDPLVQAKINTSDKLEIKRWNRRLNRFIRQIRRDGEDIQITRVGRVAAYTIGAPSSQLEIPFTPAATDRNNALVACDVDNEVLEPASPLAAFSVDMGNRALEPKNVDMSFEDLLSTLDDEAVASVAK